MERGGGESMGWAGFGRGEEESIVCEAGRKL